MILETWGQEPRTPAQTLPGHTQLGRPEIVLRSTGPQATPALHQPVLGAGRGQERM